MPDTDERSVSTSETQSSDRPSTPLCVGVVTVATDRTLEADAAGEAIETTIEKAGHEVVMREHVTADHDRVQSIVTRVIDRNDIDVIITAGATSVEPDDVTIEAVEPLLETTLPAFNILFTTLAYEVVGTEVIAARTLAGLSAGVFVCCLPGTAGAARLGTEEIILPEARTLLERADSRDP